MKSSVITHFIMILLVFNLTSCNDDGYDESLQVQIDAGLLLFLGSLRYYSLLDNQDGTLTYNVKNLLGQITNAYTLKKCLQGQVYRPAQNDCQGAGTSANGWNASLLNYCSTNDNTCNPFGQYVSSNNYYVYGPNSQIFVSCDGDTTSGLKWYPLTEIAYEDILGLFNNQLYTGINRDVPSDFGSVGVWRSEQYLGNGTSAYYLRQFTNTSYGITSALKTSLKYTLCGTYIPH